MSSSSIVKLGTAILKINSHEALYNFFPAYLWLKGCHTHRFITVVRMCDLLYGQHSLIEIGLLWTTVNKQCANRLSPNVALAITMASLICLWPWTTRRMREV
jgi:hypothetical protein